MCAFHGSAPELSQQRSGRSASVTVVSERGGQKETEVLGSCGVPKDADVERMVVGSQNFGLCG